MTLNIYVINRYFRYFIVINLSLTLIFTFIEFFEKMVRVSHTSVAAILYFLSLNFIPTFFEYFPLSSWLASFLLIREMYMQSEWEILEMLGVNTLKIALLFGGMALATLGVNFVGKEFISKRLNSQALIFKREEFKQNSPFKLFDQWFLLDEEHMCHIDYIDVSKQSGQNFLLLTLKHPFHIATILSSPTITLEPATKHVTLKEPCLFDEDAHKQTVKPTENIEIPALFDQLNLQAHPQTLPELTSQIFFKKSKLAKPLKKMLFTDWFQRIAWYLQVIIYPLFTYLFFTLGVLDINRRWLLMLSIYPLYVVLMGIAHYFATQGSSLFVLFMPFLIVLGVFTMLKALYASNS